MLESVLGIRNLVLNLLIHMKNERSIDDSILGKKRLIKKLIGFDSKIHDLDSTDLFILLKRLPVIKLVIIQQMKFISKVNGNKKDTIGYPSEYFKNIPLIN